MAAKRSVLMHKTIWCEKGWYPVYYGYCPSATAWRHAMKQFKLQHEWPGKAGFAKTCEFVNAKGYVCCMVLIPDWEHAAPLETVAIIAHEATHIWQHIKININETHPGVEQEAYAIQHITGNLLNAYVQAHGPLTITAT